MRTLSIRLMVLGLMGIAVAGICGADEEVRKEIIAQDKATKKIVSPATPLNKVVIGVLDFETSGPSLEPRRLKKVKKLLIKELRRNTRVKIINIRKSCGLSHLKRNGYEQAERYKVKHQLDMILHTNMSHPRMGVFEFYFSLIDLYTKKVREVFNENHGMPFPLWVEGLSSKILISQDLDRVLKAKKKALERKNS